MSVVVQMSRVGRGRAPGAWVILCSVAWLIAPPVRADSQALAILGLASDDDEDTAGALAEALRREAKKNSEFRLSNSHVSLSQMTMAQDCDITEAPCRGR